MLWGSWTESKYGVQKLRQFLLIKCQFERRNFFVFSILAALIYAVLADARQRVKAPVVQLSLDPLPKH